MATDTVAADTQDYNEEKRLRSEGLEALEIDDDENGYKEGKDIGVGNNQEIILNHCCNTIIEHIDSYVDQHLEKYQKYTLEPHSTLAHDDSTQFFNLISQLKDVSALGRKILESAPRFNYVQKRHIISESSSPNMSLDRKSVSTSSDLQTSSNCHKQLVSDEEEDATSEDQLAALIESSSTDDFLVLSSSLESISTKEMIVAALIYIKSHDCFTLSHDIQGVALVLRRIKFMILNILAPKNQMELVTKLLTSVRRYREMDYVFDLFRDRNQFEVLLSKGVKKTPELQIALFNYVKRNPEFYQLVTLNFSMFSEIGESLEANAMKRLAKTIAASKIRKEQSTSNPQPAPPPIPICRIVLESNSATNLEAATLPIKDNDKLREVKRQTFIYPKESLSLCLTELVDAADCYAKGGCYRRSNHCAQKAKLVALQLAILSQGTNVLGLEQGDLNELIVSLKSFNDAYIVAEAYDFHLAWRQALFDNVILENRLVYLHNFCKRCDLSPTLVEELVVTFKRHVRSRQLGQEELSQQVAAMKQLLVKLPNVELKCKIYSQLFPEDKEELLRDPATRAHLKDLKLV